MIAHKKLYMKKSSNKIWNNIAFYLVTQVDTNILLYWLPRDEMMFECVDLFHQMENLLS